MSIFRDDKHVLGDIPISRAERTPCPVCGHPTGDCTGNIIKPTHIIGFGMTEDAKNTQTVPVSEDIYEEKQISPFVKIRVLVHRKGKQIPYREAEKLGLI